MPFCPTRPPGKRPGEEGGPAVVLVVMGRGPGLILLGASVCILRNWAGRRGVAHLTWTLRGGWDGTGPGIALLDGLVCVLKNDAWVCTVATWHGWFVASSVGGISPHFSQDSNGASGPPQIVS